MGTITRAFANNITTSGVFTSSAFNNDSFDNVTAVPSGSVESGSMVLVSSATASSSASIEFTLGDYKEYKFFFVNIHPSVDNENFTFQTSTDGGSNYNTTVTSTHFRSRHYENAAGGDMGYITSVDAAQSTSFLTLFREIGNASDECGSGYLHLFNPASTTYVKHFIARGSVLIGNAQLNDDYVAGYFNDTNDLTNISFKFASGNIDDGKILMFGIN